MPRGKSEEDRHDRSRCARCQRVFWGVPAFDTHLKCGETELRGKYVCLDGIYILKRDVAYYRQIKTQMEKARKHRGM